MRGILRVIADIILTLMITMAIAIVGPNIFGIRTLAVLSGSMEPSIHTGSVVYVQPVDPADINPGDPMTFVLDEGGTVVTHRVVSADRENKLFIVRGDANNSNDPKPVYYQNVIGVVRLSVPYLGFVMVLTVRGKIIAVTAIVAMIIVIMLLGDTEEGRAKRKEGVRSHKRGRAAQEAPSRTAYAEAAPQTNAKKRKQGYYSRDIRYVSKH